MSLNAGSLDGFASHPAKKIIEKPAIAFAACLVFNRSGIAYSFDCLGGVAVVDFGPLGVADVNERA